MRYSSLMLFCVLFILLAGCPFLEMPRAITINWNEDKAESITIPKRNVEHHPGELHIRLKTPGNEVDILGTLKESEAEFIFTSAVLLILGMNYEILAGDFVLGEVVVPESDAD